MGDGTERERGAGSCVFRPKEETPSHEKITSPTRTVRTSHPLRGLGRHVPPDLKTHQMQRQGQHQEEYPQIEVARVVEFVLVRLVVPAPGQRCPDSLAQGLHDLGAHLCCSPLLLLSAQAQAGGTDDDAGADAAARLQ